MPALSHYLVYTPEKDLVRGYLGSGVEPGSCYPKVVVWFLWSVCQNALGQDTKLLLTCWSAPCVHRHQCIWSHSAVWKPADPREQRQQTYFHNRKGFFLCLRYGLLQMYRVECPHCLHAACDSVLAAAAGTKRKERKCVIWSAALWEFTSWHLKTDLCIGNFSVWAFVSPPLLSLHWGFFSALETFSTLSSSRCTVRDMTWPRCSLRWVSCHLSAVTLSWL